MQLGKNRRITGGERQTLGTQLAAAYQKGASIRTLAGSTGRSYGFIHRLLSESGVELRSQGSGQPDQKQHVQTVT